MAKDDRDSSKVTVIRAYLAAHFPDSRIIVRRPDPSTVLLVILQPPMRYELLVPGTLIERSSPDSLRLLLKRHDVAKQIRLVSNGIFSWKPDSRPPSQFSPS